MYFPGKILKFYKKIHVEQMYKQLTRSCHCMIPGGWCTASPIMRCIEGEHWPRGKAEWTTRTWDHVPLPEIPGCNGGLLKGYCVIICHIGQGRSSLNTVTSICIQLPNICLKVHINPTDSSNNNGYRTQGVGHINCNSAYKVVMQIRKCT